MISELEQYHGVVLRQLIVGAGRPVTLSLVDGQGRKDCFQFEKAAFQIRYSTRRLSPWQFSITIDQLKEMVNLAQQFRPVWIMLVCGIDGVVALSWKEFVSITEARPGGVASIRVSRSRKAMFRVSGNARELPFAKPRGVDEFLDDVITRKIET